MNEEFKLYVLFNSKTRKVTSFTFDISSFPKTILDNMLIKEYNFKDLGITDNHLNLNRFKWIGDYDSGRIVDVFLEKKSIVSENEINEKYHKIFFSKYKLEDILFSLIINTEMKDQYGKDMQEFLIKVLDKKKRDVEFFKNSPLHIWETDDDVVKQQAEAFAT